MATGPTWRPRFTRVRSTFWRSRAGVPFPSFIELEFKDKVRYIALSPEQLAALRLAMPELTPSRVPAGTYPSLLRHYQTVGLYNFAVAHADLPNDLVYNIVRDRLREA